MRNVILRPGSSGQFVRDLQLALNNRLNPSPNLIVNGLYTPQTERAVLAFQRSNWLEMDGIAGPCTLDALHGTERSPMILHNVQYLSQPTPTTCWAAATAMLTRMSVQAIRMTTPQHLLTADGSLINESERGQRLEVHQTFARLHRLRYQPPQSWPVVVLIGLLRNGPVMMELLHNPGSFQRGTGSSGHYVVIVGARGSHAEDGSSTTLRIYDPDESAGEGIYSVVYNSMLRRVPLATFGMFTQ
ncbi:peptidoglycan-binding protein [Cypionkella sp.]|uniref:peptidoglycan-binding protein n=1 Tax=Cypionkella sp. TaxID=2811411 RepID=UPI002ABCC3D1|nr:peptidoglycan-binding protein [Cypionkella sp.]MDZ4392370.1 peptidoglycan-binding protein [Cypionkella sp.]